MKKGLGSTLLLRLPPYLVSLRSSAIVAIISILTVGLSAQQPDDADRFTALINDLENRQTRRAAMDRLARHGAAAAPALTKALNSPRRSDETKANVVRTLRRMGPDATVALPLLIEIARDGGGKTRDAAVYALGEIAPYQRDLVDHVKELLDSMILDSIIESNRGGGRGEPLRTYALVSIQTLDVNPYATPKELIQVLQAADCPVRRAFAAQLLGRCDDAKELALPALRAALEAEHPGSMKWKKTIAGTSYETSMGIKDIAIKDAAARAILKLAPGDKNNLPAHVVLLAYGSDHERVEAARALGHFADDPTSATNALIESLVRRANRRKALLLREVITSLGMLGPGAKEAIPELEKVLEHEDKQIRERAKTALKQIKE